MTNKAEITTKPLSNPYTEGIKEESILILEADKVMALFQDANFIKAWDSLYDTCIWATVFQSRDFVYSWYSAYAPEFVPVMALAYKGTQLTGLLSLTYRINSKSLFHAGLGLGEYQTWLTAKDKGVNFIQHALNALNKEYPSFGINIYNIPAPTPINWVTDSTYWRKRSILKPIERPLMDLTDPEVSKLFRKKQVREKTNRLRRLGDLQFRRVTDPTEFHAIIDELILLSDFRKGARYNLLQFKVDPFAKDVLVRLYEQGILHTTVLTLNGEILASIAAIQGKNWVHLAGINCYTPLLSRHSPGLLNFIMLGQLLEQEGVRVFDLTPGGDAYKQRLATTHDYVHELYITSPLKTNFNKNIKAPIMHMLRLVARKTNKTPREVKFGLTKMKDRLKLALKNKHVQSLALPYILRGMTDHTVICHFTPEYKTSTVALKKNDLAALMNYSVTQGIDTQWDFLADAMKRFEAGEQVYTVSNDTQLIFSAWVSEYPEEDIAQTEQDVNVYGLHCNHNHTHELHDYLHALAYQLPKSEKLICHINRRAKHIWSKLTS